MLKLFGRTYTFQYFPPSKRRGDVYGGKPPKPPFPEATSEQSSVYYYWWLFLRENADYIATCENGGRGPCAEIYRDFGDVRDGNFKIWWETRGCELFCELDDAPHKPSISRINDGNVGFRELDPTADNAIVIAVNRHSNLNVALAEIRELLEFELVPDPDQPPSTALYPVFTKPVLHSLHRCYEVHKLRLANPSMPLHEFGILCGVYEQSGPVDTTTKKDSASAASRTLAQAKRLIENVGLGAFPVMTRAHEADVFNFLSDKRERYAEYKRRIQLAELGGHWCV
ncbi:MAG: hypothetical protein RSE14_10500 [Erythrobacter sp.]|uniref:hypothetical protein n=1 Tax=Erythrobacter sp. TaxID=1042 RepID=UPI002B47FD1C|nr:hypothetical protein [Erythrobacter sp.]WRH69707.1 MAG: hypothetical protein RSE14_10500 [Erythrobacter sp.]